jgi:hypothetical protein
MSVFMSCNTVSLTHGFLRPALTVIFATQLAIAVQTASGQVSPSEILNPDLKALEGTYFPQLRALNQAVSHAKFPFPFYLSRFVGIDPAQQAESDSRGLEFVRFRDRAILKVTGNYGAAYDSARLTQNERAANAFRTVVLPIVNLVAASLPQDMACDGVGFEISYHTRTRDRSFDFEGKEILVVVFDHGDLWMAARASNDLERQEILNRSQVFVSGVDFGLSLSERDPLDVQALARSVPARPDASSTARSLNTVARSSVLRTSPALPAESPAASSQAEISAATANPVLPALKTADRPVAPAASAAPPTQADADRLTEKQQTQLAAFAKIGAAKFHFVDYAPPAFVAFRNELAIQVTLRNSLRFGPAKGSIYKRAAQSFDLFLAPQLKELSERVPPELEFQLFDFSVLNKLEPGPKGASEAIEFICPRAALKQFVNADITNQQLLDQSIILVNGVRIALNLQLVE